MDDSMFYKLRVRFNTWSYYFKRRLKGYLKTRTGIAVGMIVVILIVATVIGDK